MWYNISVSRYDVCSQCGYARPSDEFQNFKQHKSEGRICIPCWSERTKECRKCRAVRNIYEFAVAKRKLDGRYSYCKTCVNDYAKKRSKKLRERGADELAQVRAKITHKRCPCCKRLRSVREFSFANMHPDGYQVHCKACNKSYAQENSQAIQARHSKRRITRFGTLHDWDIGMSSKWRKAISKMPCYYCGSSEADVYEIDHRIPVSKGGSDHWVNLVRACFDCNRSKAALDESEFWGLLKTRGVVS